MTSRSLKSSVGRVWLRFKDRLRTGRLLSRLAYYALVSDAFQRERELVAAGHREFLQRYDDGANEFLLRRNIHMLEKGLTMRPRRASFAADYIGETVTLFEAMSHGDSCAISGEVVDWAREVLAQYSEATCDSENPRIDAARGRLALLGVDSSRDNRSGPHPPSDGPSPVLIESLIALARRRNSVRWFLPSPVSHDVIDRAMEVAVQSPSACNRQPFHFRIFDDPDSVRKVAAIPMGTAGYGDNLPGIAVIVGDLAAFSDERDRHIIYTDGCLAAMAFILGLETQGVASVCINWPDIAARDLRMSVLLNLAPHERVVMLIGFGYADPSGNTPYSAKRGLSSLRRYAAL